MDGILNINKPKGMTSHDVVARLRRILKTKKIGHTGTLDPQAVGVLPICIGKATKAVDYIMEKNKKYRAELILGIKTDSQDNTGNIMSTSDVKVSIKDIENILLKFTGKIKQLPPMYSAIKINGQKLYDLARKGQEVDREYRNIEIFNIEIIQNNLDQNKLIIDVECSKGTYIRTLCNDIGESLGTYGIMGSLIRLSSGQFKIEDSISLEQVEKLYNENNIDEYLIPIDSLFSKFERITVRKTSNKWVYNGGPIYPKDILEKTNNDKIYRVYDEEGNFLALYEKQTDNNKIMFTAHKMFL